MLLSLISFACSGGDPEAANGAPPDGTGRVVHEYRRKWYRDADGDGHGDPDTWHRSYTRPPGHVANATDCDDDRAEVYRDCELELADADLVIRGMDGELIGLPMVVGDPTGDGVDDVIIGSYRLDDSTGGAYIVAGPEQGTVTASRVGIDLAYVGREQLQFGIDLAVGDANSDGFDDVLVGSFRYGSRREGPGLATVFTYFGPVTSRQTDRTADALWEGSPNEELDDMVVASDVTGDSVGDLLFGDWGALSYPMSGAVFVVDGTATGTHAWTDEATHVYYGTFVGSESYGLGYGVVDLGDATGDGISDFATQSALDVAVIEGGDAPGFYEAAATAAATVIRGAQVHTLGGGDWDGDGLGDLFVPGGESVVAYLGPLSGPLSADDANASWSSADGSVLGLGDQVIELGDADGDGASDVLMAAMDPEPPGGGEGIAWLQRGLVSGAVDIDTLLSFPAGEYDLIGVSGAFVRDWTGDGADEIALGSTRYLSPDDRGAIYVLSSDQIF